MVASASALQLPPVADGPRSRVFQQAGNRLHAQKPILLKLLG